MKFREQMTLGELIQIIRLKEDEGESYCIYGKGDSTEIDLSSVCYLDVYPEITEDYEEVYPDFVTSNGLELWFREELAQDVVFNVINQDSNATDGTVLEAIKYYDEKDCFMSL